MKHTLIDFMCHYLTILVAVQVCLNHTVLRSLKKSLAVCVLFSLKSVWGEMGMIFSVLRLYVFIIQCHMYTLKVSSRTRNFEEGLPLPTSEFRPQNLLNSSGVRPKRAI